MEEQDYIELQTLLAKLRVFCLKELGNPEVTTKEREMNFKLIRSIDNIKNKAPLKINKNLIETEKGD